ncbi:helix-turn-helix domain-containing protein [Pseudactinotalea sp. HY160]|uniref:helix-turn-helix domain-containing protein n=1 Tax=Pseudactinotalea sp. HY160 TaxID=2654490 RepID=UPI00128C0470|nr:helix-turn-helix domain-containing protein [Pseudactinotalea sp. HY160]MPV50275.1 helix-turn-helix domain-containing protein [Pseudactinotalea sp. HY160]
MTTVQLPAELAGARLLTTAEAAAYLSLSPRTLRNWRWLGRGPIPVYVGGAVRYRVGDLNAYVAGGAR